MEAWPFGIASNWVASTGVRFPSIWNTALGSGQRVNCWGWGWSRSEVAEGGGRGWHGWRAFAEQPPFCNWWFGVYTISQDPSRPQERNVSLQVTCERAPRSLWSPSDMHTGNKRLLSSAGVFPPGCGETAQFPWWLVFFRTECYSR